jgi:hypothetical protein
MLAIFAQCLLDVFGGIALAAGAAWFGWTAFKPLHWPEAGPWIVVLTLILIPGAMSQSLLQTTLLFLVCIAACLIPAGRIWRKQQRLRRLFHRHNVKVMRQGLRQRTPPRHLV